MERALLLRCYQAWVCNSPVWLGRFHVDGTAVKYLTWTRESAVIHPGTMQEGEAGLNTGQVGQITARLMLSYTFVRLNCAFVSSFGVLCATFQGCL